MESFVGPTAYGTDNWQNLLAEVIINNQLNVVQRLV